MRLKEIFIKVYLGLYIVLKLNAGPETTAPK